MIIQNNNQLTQQEYKLHYYKTFGKEYQEQTLKLTFTRTG